VLSESARATTRQEARFRVPYPNSRPRIARLVALDRASEPFVAHLTRGHDRRVFLPLWGGEESTAVAMGRDAGERARALVTALDATDLVVMVSMSGHDNPAASVIADACRLRRVPVVVFVLDNPSRPAAGLSDTLAHLRPYATMLVRAADEAYVEDMLGALRV